MSGASTQLRRIWANGSPGSRTSFWRVVRLPALRARARAATNPVGVSLFAAAGVALPACALAVRRRARARSV